MTKCYRCGEQAEPSLEYSEPLCVVCEDEFTDWYYMKWA